jgi:ribosomal protein S21
MKIRCIEKRRTKLPNNNIERNLKRWNKKIKRQGGDEETKKETINN